MPSGCASEDDLGWYPGFLDADLLGECNIIICSGLDRHAPSLSVVLTPQLCWAPREKEKERAVLMVWALAGPGVLRMRPCSASSVLTRTACAGVHSMDLTPVAPRSLSRRATEGDNAGSTSRPPEVVGAQSRVPAKRSYSESDAASGGKTAQGSAQKCPRTDPDAPVLVAQGSWHWQKAIEKLCVGVRWEVARVVSLGLKHPTASSETARYLTYDALKLDWLNKLCGGDKDGANARFAPRAARSIYVNWMSEGNDEMDPRNGDMETAFKRERDAKSPWQALDEEENMLKDQKRGDGSAPFNGTVWFHAKLKKAERGALKIELQPPTLGPSCRFTRKFGSASHLRVSLPKEKGGVGAEALQAWFIRPFVINGQVFRAFYEKERTVFLFRTAEVYDPRTESIMPDQNDRWSLQRFLDWHNPMELNQNQTIGKWAFRMGLGLSSSVAGVGLAPDHVHPIDEQISAIWPAYKLHHPEVKKPPSWMEMTDGCGFINRAGLRALRKTLEWDYLPVAVQVRVRGAKGLLLLHPGAAENEDPEPRIWLRPSQEKIKYDPGVVLSDSTLSTIDVLRPAHMRTPSRLSGEVMVNLGENGVDPQVLVNLMETALDDCINSLTDWEGEDGCIKLWHAVDKTWGVRGARLARQEAVRARACGLTGKDFSLHADDGEDDDEEGIDGVPENAVKDRSTAWWPDEISGCPSSLPETVIELLSSGFSPDSCIVLRRKYREAIKKLIERRKSSLFIPTPMTARAWIVPDPVGVLAIGEVHIKSSQRNLKMKTPDGEEVSTDILEGDVLITRNPCKLPTDVKKVKAVVYPELKDYVDVIVLPVTGFRSLASELAGGDYDGDEVLVIHDPRIVQGFHNADSKYLWEPASVTRDIDEDKTLVSDFLRLHRESDNLAREQQKVVLANLGSDSLKGLYSTMHDYVVYTRGYHDPDAIRLAYLFSGVALDGMKSGKKIKVEASRRDRRQFLAGKPWWALATAITETQNPVCAKRANSRCFVLDAVVRAAQKAAERHLVKIDRLLQDNMARDPIDQHLLRPWAAARSSAEQQQETKIGALKTRDLDLIEKHVRDIFKERQDEMRLKPDQSFTVRPIVSRQDVLRQVSWDFASAPSLDQMLIYNEDDDLLQRLKASCAYTLYHTRGVYSPFPFDVAFRVLCDIKAKAAGGSKTLHHDFAAHHALHKVFLKK